MISRLKLASQRTKLNFFHFDMQRQLALVLIQGAEIVYILCLMFVCLCNLRPKGPFLRRDHSQLIVQSIFFSNMLQFDNDLQTEYFVFLTAFAKRDF